MTLNFYSTKDYENKRLRGRGENKPKQTQFQRQKNAHMLIFAFPQRPIFYALKKGQSAIMPTDITNTSWITMVSKEQIATVGYGLLVRAPAKINLSLLIAGKRPDGFQELETVMAKVGFYDEILIEPSEKAGIELVCRGPRRALEEKDNLVYRA